MPFPYTRHLRRFLLEQQEIIPCLWELKQPRDRGMEIKEEDSIISARQQPWQDTGVKPLKFFNLP